MSAQIANVGIGMFRKDGHCAPFWQAQWSVNRYGRLILVCFATPHRLRWQITFTVPQWRTR